MHKTNGGKKFIRIWPKKLIQIQMTTGAKTKKIIYSLEKINIQMLKSLRIQKQVSQK